MTLADLKINRTYVVVQRGKRVRWRCGELFPNGARGENLRTGCETFIRVQDVEKRVIEEVRDARRR